MRLSKEAKRLLSIPGATIQKDAMKTRQVNLPKPKSDKKPRAPRGSTGMPGKHESERIVIMRDNENVKPGGKE